MNVDGGMRLSTYFAKDKDTKLFMPMVWDFDLALGNCSYLEKDFNLEPGMGGPEGWFIKIRGGSFEYGDWDGSRKSYYQYLFEDPVFAARVRDRFNELLPQLQTIPDYIDELEQLLDRSAQENFKLWNPAEDAWMNGGRIINGDENMSYHEAVARLRSIYQERLTVIGDNLK